eukprot:TRINITY_DN96653_c0_g1_i1.p1 TRINITY_DN96653_c0_g1~~TRINITY_DN96653_c0_g1_i1.p1  ORF type:complete len:306 (-),score=57.28 TRINITY_DN96653_c0_g1_i1:38-928(-)
MATAVAADGSWRPSPRCPKGHVLEPKVVAGSWKFLGLSGKSCQDCRSELTAGSLRHSCKKCFAHVCASCHAQRVQKMLSEEITLTLYRAAQSGLLPGLGMEEDTFQVQLARGAKVSQLQLKARLQELYGIPLAMQVLRRDLEGAALRDDELVACDEDGDVIYLGSPFAGPNTGDSIADFLQGAMVDLSDMANGMLAHVERQRQELEQTEYTLNILAPATHASAGVPSSRPERRCRLTVMATACVRELREMALLELDAEQEPLAFEFAGQKLPESLPLHMLDISNDDTLMLVPELPG